MKSNTIRCTVLIAVLSAAMIGCKNAHSYANLTAEQVAQENKISHREGVAADEWLKVVDVQQYRIRYPTRWLSPEQVALLTGLMRSPKALIRQVAESDLANPKTDADRAIECPLLEPMTHDEDSNVRLTALALLFRAHDPNVKALAQQELQAPNASDHEKQRCNNLIEGRPLTAD